MSSNDKSNIMFEGSRQMPESNRSLEKPTPPRNEGKIRSRLIAIKCKRCNLFSWIDTAIVHAEEGTPFVWHCTYCTYEIQLEKVE